MSNLFRLLYSEYFLAVEIKSRFCTKEECRNNLFMTKGIQLEALEFLIQHRTE